MRFPVIETLAPFARDVIGANAAIQMPLADVAREMAVVERRASLRKVPVVSGLRQVKSEAREGQQTGIPATAFTNRTLFEAKRSRLGVFALGSPAYPKAAARHWSAITNRTLG